VQITVAETVGAGGRWSYYDHYGALRDIVQNHLLQLLCLVAMEPPANLQPDSVRNEKVKVIRSLRPIGENQVEQQTVRGQYTKGFSEGGAVPGYTQEKDGGQSTTETFVALKLTLDNWRWADVPFYIRTGKRMATKNSTIMVEFKKAPFVLFRETGVERLRTNRIVIHIQPDEGITLHFGAKVPGPIVNVGPVDMDFNYSDHFGEQVATGYERLLYDCMIGDATLFQRADMVEAAWCIVTPILDVWSAIPARDFPNYAAGTWGPPEADELLSKDGRAWKNMVDG